MLAKDIEINVGRTKNTFEVGYFWARLTFSQKNAIFRKLPLSTAKCYPYNYFDVLKGDFLKNAIFFTKKVSQVFSKKLEKSLTYL